MININVKNLKTNSSLLRQLCKKYKSFIQYTRAETYVKLTLEMYESTGTILRFPFLILFLRSLKLGKFLPLSKRMSQITGTKIEYTFGPAQRGLNKRSGKQRTKSQIVRGTIFFV